MGRQQAPELHRGGVELLCSMPAQPASTVRRAIIPVKALLWYKPYACIMLPLCLPLCLLFPCSKDHLVF